MLPPGNTVILLSDGGKQMPKKRGVDVEFASKLDFSDEALVAYPGLRPPWSDLDVVFTMILCATNFSYLVSYEAHIHKFTLNSFWEHAHLISKPYDLKSKLINNCFNSSAQRLMVKTKQTSDLPWSAIFCVIVYFPFVNLGILKMRSPDGSRALKIRSLARFSALQGRWCPL